MHIHVILEFILIEKAIAAARMVALERLHTRMATNVQVQITFLFELLSTNVARMMFLIRVRNHVLLIASNVAKFLPAYITLEWKFTCVNFSMFSVTCHSFE